MTTSRRTTQSDLPGSLLRKVAHDIVGPTGVASGALKEVERAMGAEGAAHASMLALAFRSLQRLERLAKRLRLTALLHDGQLELDAEPIVVAEHLRAAVGAAAALDGRKNITLEGPAVEEALSVMADKEHLSFALAELTSNSLRFARQRVRIAASREGDLVVMLFEDDGPGFPSDLPLSLGPGVGLPRQSGLALPIVASLAQRFGGRLVLGPSSLVTAADKRPGAMARLELPALG